MGLFSSGSSGNPKEELQQMNQSQEMEKAEKRGSDLTVIISMLSVLLAWYQFFYQQNRLQGIFIGLWPPTFLGLANYMKAKSMEEQGMMEKLLK